jgi:hypothetical protein
LFKGYISERFILIRRGKFYEKNITLTKVKKES